MATKKQKREAALAKREKFMAETRAFGLAAQERDQKERQRREESFRELANRRTVSMKIKAISDVHVHVNAAAEGIATIMKAFKQAFETPVR